MPPNLRRPFAGLESVDFTGLRLRLVDAENQVRFVVQAPAGNAHAQGTGQPTLCPPRLCADHWQAGVAAECVAARQGQAHLCPLRGPRGCVHRGQCREGRVHWQQVGGQAVQVAHRWVSLCTSGPSSMLAAGQTRLAAGRTPLTTGRSLLTHRPLSLWHTQATPVG